MTWHCLKDHSKKIMKTSPSINDKYQLYFIIYCEMLTFRILFRYQFSVAVFPVVVLFKIC